LSTRLDDSRLTNFDWCRCSNTISSGPNCCARHRRPKAAFCCKEGAAATTRWGCAYSEKIGSHSCITKTSDFYRRGL